MLATRPLDLPYRPCVGIMLINRDGRVWVGRRRPKWAADGSALHLADAAGRHHVPARPSTRRRCASSRRRPGCTSVELLAEAPGWLSYDLPDELLGIALKGRYRGQRQKWFAMRFTGREPEIDIAPRGGHKAEFDAWRWANVSELPSLPSPSSGRSTATWCASSAEFRGVVASSAAAIADVRKSVSI